VPIDNFSLQDMWCVYSDLAEANHIAPGKPQGIEIYQTVYAWNYPANQDIFFIIYQVRNTGSDTLKRCYMGAVMDADIGDATDDMVGLLLNDSVPGAGWVKNVGYAGDYDNLENPSSTWESGTPGVFAYKFLESPRRPNQPDSLLGMTAFKKFTIDIDPVTDPAQYLTMAGYDYRTGVYSPYDSVDVAKADKRFIQCSGPFDLPPGRVERLIVAAIAAPFGGPGQVWPDRPKDSLIHLATVANNAQFIYDQGWLLPGPPPSPNITLVPGDNQVRIVWDNLPETKPDKYWEKVASQPGPGYDPKYRGYDFQGYMVYKSEDGIDWELIGQCDLRDTFPSGEGADTVWVYPPGGDSTLADSLWIQLRNSGTYYSLLDKNVVNGFQYYYCVTAYDWNYVTTEWDSLHQNPVAWDTLILRSGIVSNYSTIPRWDAPNYRMPQCSIICVAGAQTNNGLSCSTTVVIPAQVRGDTYALRFLDPEYVSSSASRYRYLVTNLRTDSVAVDTQIFSYTVASPAKATTVYVPVFNGQQLKLKLKVGIPSTAFDGVAVKKGDYPADSLGLVAVTPGIWAFRGSDYQVVWEMLPSGYLTAKVFDLTNGGIEVPFSPFGTTGSGPRKANGWCFLDKLVRQPTDTLRGTAASLYICGGQVWFRQQSRDSLRQMLNLIQAGDTWLLTGHRAEGAAPFYNVYHIVSVPGYTDSTTKLTLNVKVVPNPYIVFDQWEKTSEQRVLKFTHLPSFCTIRIFTTAGDLVKVIEHKDTKTNPLDLSGTETWDLLNDNQQLIASGVYIFHVESPVGEFTGKFAFIH